MRAQWLGALWGGVVVLVLAAIGFYAYWQSVRNAQPMNTIPTSTIQALTLEAQFKGPLKDTLIQRWKDEQTGATCYIYLPIVVQHSPTTPTGYVQYGANGIGAISCIAAR